MGFLKKFPHMSNSEEKKHNLGEICVLLFEKKGNWRTASEYWFRWLENGDFGIHDKDGQKENSLRCRMGCFIEKRLMSNAIRIRKFFGNDSTCNSITSERSGSKTKKLGAI
ncbi:hypothetical protein TNIN_85611 [Trichonephila inaurata madagascariensis]|uniref:Uncharacterized protein n=1 Tax=Trichonephila inaurata madagascariensis TaxID=2747483 RepID=A0A8X7C9G0_9ARAC|nr:hypothetical protein TNIN_85611 [Trichonephila inaurata madagascariensis]